MKAMSRKGFTLIEILIVVIILGILAAIVIPQFSSATDDTRKATMLSSLKSLRTQIALYQMEHRDTPPSETNADFWNQMTKCTMEDGTAKAAGDVTDRQRSGEYRFGPYFEDVVVNALTKSSAIADAPADNVGWVYVVNGNDVKLYGVMAQTDADTGAVTYVATTDGKTAVTLE